MWKEREDCGTRRRGVILERRAVRVRKDILGRFNGFKSKTFQRFGIVKSRELESKARRDSFENMELRHYPCAFPLRTGISPPLRPLGPKLQQLFLCDTDLSERSRFRRLRQHSISTPSNSLKLKTFIETPQILHHRTLTPAPSSAPQTLYSSSSLS